MSMRENRASDSSISMLNSNAFAVVFISFMSSLYVHCCEWFLQCAHDNFISCLDLTYPFIALSVSELWGKRLNILFKFWYFSFSIYNHGFWLATTGLALLNFPSHLEFFLNIFDSGLALMGLVFFLFLTLVLSPIFFDLRVVNNSYTLCQFWLCL